MVNKLPLLHCLVLRSLCCEKALYEQVERWKKVRGGGQSSCKEKSVFDKIFGHACQKNRYKTWCLFSFKFTFQLWFRWLCWQYHMPLFHKIDQILPQQRFCIFSDSEAPLPYATLQVFKVITAHYLHSSCSSLVRTLVYQPSGPGLIPGMSRSETVFTREKPEHAAATHHMCVYYMLIYLHMKYWAVFIVLLELKVKLDSLHFFYWTTLNSTKSPCIHKYLTRTKVGTLNCLTKSKVIIVATLSFAIQ